ncbi:MAG TPA: AMIN domain-containing protein, partial [Gammaproteobacteria bacterium]
MNIKHYHFGIKTCTEVVSALMLALTMLYAPVGNAQTSGASQNQLQSITATKLTGERVQLELKLSGPAPQPLTFTVNQPARLALDLSSTSLDLKNRKTDISVGAVNSVVAAEAGGRTRVVVNLTTLVPYNVTAKGNTVYVILGSSPNDTEVAQASPTSFGPASTASATVPVATPAASAAASTATPAVSATSSNASPAVPLTGNVLTAVDFRRGNGGIAQVMVNLSNPGIIGNVHSTGANVVVDFANAHLPTNLVRRMDVTDFATPVQYIDAENTATGARLVIHPSGKYDKLAYQSDNTFSVEF